MLSLVVADFQSWSFGSLGDFFLCGAFFGLASLTRFGISFTLSLAVGVIGGGQVIT